MMHIAVKHQRTYSDEVATFSRQLGIAYVQLTTPEFLGADFLEKDKLIGIRRRVEDNGQQLVMIENVPARMTYRILYGLDGRERQLDNYRITLRNMGEAAIHLLGVNFMPNQVWRTAWSIPARGGAAVSGFDEEQARHGNRDRFTRGALAGVAIDKQPTAEELWDNFRLFLSEVLEEARRSGVRIALHPDDPPLPRVGGIDRIFYCADNLLKAVALADSPYFGLNLCLGSLGAAREGKAGIERLIDALVPEEKVFSVHFRGVRGQVPAFRECFLDESDIDLADILKRLKNRGYQGCVMDDHYPHMAGDDALGLRARAYAIGYIKGLLRMMDGEDEG